MNDILPSTGYVRLPVVLKIIPVGRSTWYAGIRSGRFPPGVKLTPRVTVWNVQAIRELIKRFE